MKSELKKVVIIAAAVVGIAVVTAALVFALSLSTSVSEKSPIIGALIIGAVIGIISLPVFIWMAVKPPSLDSYSAFALEEIEMNEDELFEAVSNWIYAEHKMRAEGAVKFLEDEEGNVGCRVTVRKD